MLRNTHHPSSLSTRVCASDGGGVQCESGLKGPLGPTVLRLIAHMENSEDGRVGWSEVKMGGAGWSEVKMGGVGWSEVKIGGVGWSEMKMVGVVSEV